VESDWRLAKRKDSTWRTRRKNAELASTKTKKMKEKKAA
jgi:hypothetical protein